MHFSVRFTATASLCACLGALASCGSDSDPPPIGIGAMGGSGGVAGTGGSGGTSGTGGTGGEPVTFGEDGWFPSSGLTPHYFLQPDNVFRVHPTHPRLFFRQDDIDWIKARGQGPLSAQWGNLEWMSSSMAELSPSGPEATDNVKGWYGSKGEAIAFMALMTGNQAYVDWSVEWIKALGALPMPTEDTPLRARIQRISVVYDWLYDVMPSADRTEIRDILIRYIEVLRDWGYIEDPGYIGGHERWGYAVFAMGLIALHGDYPDADRLLEQCREHIARGFYPAQAWIAEDGGYHMGWAYTSAYTNFDLPYLVWTVGTNDVVMDDWMAETGAWYLYGLRGDDTFPQAGDAYSISPSQGATNSIYAAGPGQSGQSRWYIQNKIEEVSESLLQMVMIDPEVQPEPPDALPKGRLFQRAGQVIARDAWDVSTTHFAFKSGAFFSINHHHRDENTFTLHYKGPLAIDSGFYDAYGTDHWKNYFTRTIAHNGIVVFNPSQQMTLYGNDVSNDGGQTFNQEPRSLEDIQVSGHASLDGIVRYENRDAFTYGWGDATKAYDPATVTLAQRDVVYLRETDRAHPVIVIFDRVGATDTAFEKKFLLHTIDQPTVQANIMVNANNGGRLTSVTLHPTDAQLALEGGAGREYWVNGTNWPLNDAPPDGIHPGGWRLEVSPGESHDVDYFLHVLFVDDDPSAPVSADDAQLITGTDALGVEVAGWTVVFPLAQDGASSITYDLVRGGVSQHLVAGMPVQQSMTYIVSGGDPGTLTTGEGGCAVFEVTTSAGSTVSLL